jgi:hypothetical protein
LTGVAVDDELDPACPVLVAEPLGS